MTWVYACVAITWTGLLVYGFTLFLKERALVRRLATLEADHA